MPGTSLLGSVAELFDSCRYLFVFVTQNLVKANLDVFLTSIATSLTSEEKEKDRLIPVKTAKSCDLLMLAPLQPLKYYQYLEAKEKQQYPDYHFIKCFRKLIDDGRLKYLIKMVN